MKVELKRNVLYGVRTVKPGETIEVSDELGNELVANHLAKAVEAKVEAEKLVPSAKSQTENKAK